MDELAQALKVVPPDKQAAIRAWWTAQTQKGHTGAVLLGQVRAKYAPEPSVGEAVAVPSSEVARPGLPSMGAAPTIEAAQPGPRIPITERSRPGTLASLGYALANTVPFADEAIGALTSRQVSGPNYETARRLAEYQLGRGAQDHPVATGIGTAAGLAGLALTGSGTPEVLGAEGMGRQILRNAAVNTGIGAVYGAGASDPGERIRGALQGAIGGLAITPVATGAGELLGAGLGTSRGRMARSIAERGETPLASAQAALNQAHPTAPLTAADILGPLGPSRIRAGSVIPGPAQELYQDTYLTRQAGRPARVQSAIEDVSGRAGNPYAAAARMQAERGAEADRLYGEALMPGGKDLILPRDQTAPLLKIPRVKDLIDEYRAINAEAGAPSRPVNRQALGWAQVTGRELQYVKRRLGELGDRFAPGESAVSQTKGRAAQSVLGKVNQVLSTIPGYPEANAAYAERSAAQEAFQQGTQALQTDPALVEHTLSQATPATKEAFRLGVPASTAKAIESGTARGTLTRLGLGESPRIGRQRVFNTIFPPEATPRLQQLLRDEDRMLPAERAAEAATVGSSTEPNRQSVVESGLSGLSFGVPGLIRREVLGALRAAPNPQALNREAQILTTSGPGLRGLLGEAQQAQALRGQSRKGFSLLGRAITAGIPTASRVTTARDRSAQEDAYEALRRAGFSEEEALRRITPETP